MALAETAVAAKVAADAAVADAVVTTQAAAAATGGKMAAWAIPTFGLLSLVGIVAWEFWQGSQDAKEMKGAKA
jgi:hypothetical protein